MAAIQQQGMANQSKPPSLGKRKIDQFQVLSESDKELFQRQARMLRPNDIVCGRAFSKLCKNWKRSGWKIFPLQTRALITISTIELKHIDLRFRLLLKGRSLPFTLSATLQVLISQVKIFRTLKF